MTKRSAWGWFYLAVVIVVVVAAQGGLLPRWVAPYTRNGVDKVLHFLIFGGLGLVIGLWAAHRRPHVRRLVWLGLLLLCALDELSQTMLPHRSAEWLDLGADWTGLSCFYWLACRRHDAKTAHVHEAEPSKAN